MALSDFQSVQDVLNNYKEAVFARDVERFLASYAEDARVFDCWGPWERVGIADLRTMATDWFAGLAAEDVKVKVELDNAILSQSDTIASVHCEAVFAAYENKPGGQKLRQIKNRFTFSLKKDVNGWRITHKHSSLPVNIETGKAIIQ